MHNTGQMNKSQERIYSSQQLIVALRSGLSAVKDQLSVLTILDNTASSWPGVQQSTNDLEFLIEMVSNTITRLDKDASDKDSEVSELRMEVHTLKETLALQQEAKDDLTRQVESLDNDLRTQAATLETVTKESAQQKQELWALEKQRAELASESERLKQDNEFMEGEINTLRATVTEQMTQITALKEELAGRRADVSHLTQLSADQKAQLDHIRRQLDSALSQCEGLRAALAQAQHDKDHHEREADRLHEEVARLGAELDKTAKDLERIRDWSEVCRKVDADKLREEQDARNKDHMEYQAQKAALDKRLAMMQSQLSHTTEKLKAKEAEADTLRKQSAIQAVSAKNLQSDLSAMSNERMMMLKQIEDLKAAIARLESQVSAQKHAATQNDTQHVQSLQRVKDQAATEVARHKAAAEEARREAAVQKALSEGWSRDVRDAQERLKHEHQKAAHLQQRVDELMSEQQARQMENMRAATDTDAHLKTLATQLDASQAEVKRLKAEYASEVKRFEKQVEALQRECNESALEIRKLRSADNSLPSLKPVTMQDELNNLKKVLTGMAASGDMGTGRLPAVRSTSRPGGLTATGGRQVSR